MPYDSGEDCFRLSPAPRHSGQDRVAPRGQTAHLRHVAGPAPSHRPAVLEACRALGTGGRGWAGLPAATSQLPSHLKGPNPTHTQQGLQMPVRKLCPGGWAHGVQPLGWDARAT